MLWVYWLLIPVVIGNIGNIYKRWWCWPIWITADIGYIIANEMIHQHAQTAMFVLFIGMNVWGLIEWKRKIKCHTLN